MRQGRTLGTRGPPLSYGFVALRVRLGSDPGQGVTEALGRALDPPACLLHAPYSAGETLGLRLPTEGMYSLMHEILTEQWHFGAPE